ncbi:hypothetical protein AAG906_028004 [Vitis piasezkii]
MATDPKNELISRVTSIFLTRKKLPKNGTSYDDILKEIPDPDAKKAEKAAFNEAEKKREVEGEDEDDVDALKVEDSYAKAKLESETTKGGPQ